MSRPGGSGRTLLEAGALTALAAGATKLLSAGGPDWLQSHRGVLIAAVWLYLPLLAAWLRRLNWQELGLGRPPLRQSLILVGVWVLLTYPLFYFVWGWAQVRWLGRSFAWTWPPEFAQTVLVQTLAIALPEEVFFRGYLQGRLNSVFGRRWRLWGAELGPGLFLAALVFVLCHLLIYVTWLRVAILFPALLFGWMRERTGSLFAPVLFHALSNLTFIVAQGMFR